MALSTQTLGAPARPGKQNLLFGLLLVLRQEHFVLKFKHHSELTVPRDCWWTSASTGQKTSLSQNHGVWLPSWITKPWSLSLPTRCTTELCMTSVLTDYCMCKTNALWFSPEAAQRKVQEKKKHKGNRKRKRQTRFCFINWKWLALWKPLFFGFRNLPHTHTKKSNSIEGHEYYTENCFPFINHFCECELIILASILLLAGSKLSWTKKKVPLNQNHFPLPMAAFGHLC